MPAEPPRSPAETPARREAAARGWWHRLEERLWSAPEDAGRDLRDFVRRWLQIVDRSLRGFVTNHGLTHASALTYTTLLAVVPLLAVLLAVLKGFNVDEAARQALRQLPFFSQAYVVRAEPGRPDAVAGPEQPVSMAELGERLIDLVSHTNFKNLGVIGVLTLMLLIVSLLSQIEAAMNEAWAVYRSRTVARMLADYMNLLMVVLALLLAFVGILTVRVGDWIRSIPALGGMPGIDFAGATALRVAPYLLLLGAFVFLYYYMPNTRVRWRSAAAGGIAAWFVYCAMQGLFLHFQSRLLGARVMIYGAFGSVLLVLFFVYLFWCVVLWGVEVSSAHQNLRDWRRRRRRWLGLPAERETMALRLAALLARPLLGRPDATPLDLGALADRLNVPPQPVAETLELFRAHGLVVQTAEEGGYLLARSPDDLRALDLLRLVRTGSLAPDAAEPGGPSLPDVLTLTLKQLADRPLDSIRTLAL